MPIIPSQYAKLLEALEQSLEILLSVLAVWMILYGVFRLVCYIFRSVGLFTMAKRRGIHRPWLAWIPVGRAWITGSISDQYQYLVKGKYRALRKWMLTLSIISLALSAVSGVVSGVMAASELENLLRLPAMGSQYIAAVLQFMLVVLSLSMAAWAVGVVLAVLRYVALFHLFRSCGKDNSVLFLVLSILVRDIEPFLIFAVRKQDGGMPPRRVVPHCESVEE